MMLKQHSFLDVVGGVLLALILDLAAERMSSPSWRRQRIAERL